MLRRLGILAVVISGVLFVTPWQARAAQIPRLQPVGAVVSTSFGPSGYTSVFDGTGVGAALSVNIPGKVAASVGTNFHMTVTAAPCCTVHSFILGPWTGTWSVDGNNGDTLSGTASGTIDTECVEGLSGFCALAFIGPGVSFTLTITSGTGRYSGASGIGSLTGTTTPEGLVGSSSTPSAAFVGQLTLSDGAALP